MTIEFNKEFLREFFRENDDAVRLCVHLEYCSVLADDLISGKRKRGGEDVLNSYWICLVDIPANSFYREHYQRLHPLVKKVLLAWYDLIKHDDRKYGFVLRGAIANFSMECARITNGEEGMKNIKDYLYQKTCLPERFDHHEEDLWE